MPPAQTDQTSHIIEVVEPSVSASVLKFFMKNPEEELSVEDIALKFGVLPELVPSMLEAEAASGALQSTAHVRRAGQKKSHPTVYSAGQHITQVRFIAANNAQQGKPYSRRVPEADGLVVHRARPMPSLHRKPPKGKPPGWNDVFDKLQAPGMSVDIPANCAENATAAAVRRKKQGLGCFAVRRVDDATYGIWRLNDDGSVPQSMQAA